jgi:hypothetical protein
MSNYIVSPSKVKRFILDYAKENQKHLPPAYHITRIRQSSVDRVEAAARAACRSIFHSAPSKGKTL